MIRYLFIGFLLFSFFPFVTRAQKKQKPVSIVFDSDMGPDYDDVGALSMLHAFADNGEAEILATIASNRQSEKAVIFKIINTYFKRPNIPIGIPQGIAVERKDSRGWGQMIVQKYSDTINSPPNTYGAVELYRKILSEQRDHSVVIVTVGFFTNVAKLLESEPDTYSDLDGKQLIEKKVKRMVSMAGKFPQGKEHNVLMDVPSANYVFQNWPTEIIFSGFEVGERLKTGIPLIRDSTITESPVKDVYRMCMSQSINDMNGRSSWDQTAVLVAVRGASPYYEKVKGHISVNSSGYDSWDFSEGDQFYLVINKSENYMEIIINDLMKHQP